MEKDDETFAKRAFIDYTDNIVTDKEIKQFNGYKNITENKEYLLPPSGTALAASISCVDGIDETNIPHRNEMPDLY